MCLERKIRIADNNKIHKNRLQKNLICDNRVLQEMIERMTALLPAERQPLSRNIVPRRDNFEVLYHLHFDNLCADFQVCKP
jgi:hypothetical protein